MFDKLIATAATAALMTAQALPLFAGAVLLASPAHAADTRFWGCDAGYDFQVSGESGRCFKAGETDTGAPLPCVKIATPLGAVGAALRIDANGENDVCATNVGGIVFTGEVSCGFGWTMDRRAGADRCTKRSDPVVRQPTRVIS